MNEEAIPDLPPEIILEILAFLPLKPLVKCQLICRELRALIASREFMKKHMNGSQCSYLKDYVTKSSPTATAKKRFRFSHVFDGLIVMRNVSSKKSMLWNPATRLALKLPDPLGYSYGLTLSFAPATRRYKLVSFFKDEDNVLCCQILSTTLGQNMEWRRLKSPFLDMLIADVVKVKLFSLVKVVHCAVVLKFGEEEVRGIISLDVETEGFTMTYLPSGVFRGAQNVVPLEWNGRIAFCKIGRRFMHVMVLEDYNKGRWCREKEVIPLRFRKDKGFKGKGVIPLFGKEGETWFKLRNKKTFIYTIQTRKTIEVNEEGSFAFWSKVNRYKPSFVTFNGMQPDEELDKYWPRLKLD